VTFVVDPQGSGSTVDISANVVPIDDDPLTGVAVAILEGKLGNELRETFEITLDVGGFYSNDEFPGETLVTVSRPTGDFITGGGYLIEKSSYGGTATLTKTIENPDGSTTVLAEELDLDVADGSKMTSASTSSGTGGRPTSKASSIQSSGPRMGHDGRSSPRRPTRCW
jgi:hypothetical protein